MGYNTRYTIVSLDGDVMKFRQAFSRHKLATDSGYRFFGIGVGSDEAMKWYEHDEHIVDAMADSNALSLVLHGEGEESGDVWDKRYTWKDGAILIETFKFECAIGEMIKRPELLIKAETKRPNHIPRIK